MRNLYQPKMKRDIRCPQDRGHDLFSGKWKTRIICILNEAGTLRYSELREEMGDITDAMLASALKGLIADDLVVRQSYDEIPPRVEYSLTEKGSSVMPVLKKMCKWCSLFYEENTENTMRQCQNCDYRNA